jgi:hypothetical protein
LCKILKVDEIYVKGSFVNDFVKDVQILCKINVMIYIYIYESNPFVNECVKDH